MNHSQENGRSDVIEQLVDYSNKSTVKNTGYNGNPILTLLASVGNYSWSRLCREAQLAW